MWSLYNRFHHRLLCSIVLVCLMSLDYILIDRQRCTMLHLCLGCLGVSVVQWLGRRTSDLAVMGSILGPRVIRHLGQLNSAFHLSRVGKSSTSLHPFTSRGKGSVYSLMSGCK